MSDAGNAPDGNDRDGSRLDDITLSELRAAEKDPRHSLRDPDNPRHGKYLKAKREMAKKFQDPVRGTVVPNLSTDAWNAMASSIPDVSGLVAEELKDSIPNFSKLATENINMPEFDQLRESSAQINEMVNSLLARPPHQGQDVRHKAITPETGRERPRLRPGADEEQLRFLKQMMEQFERRIDIAEREAQLRSQNSNEVIEEERKHRSEAVKREKESLELQRQANVEAAESRAAATKSTNATIASLVVTGLSAVATIVMGFVALLG